MERAKLIIYAQIREKEWELEGWVVEGVGDGDGERYTE